MLTHRSSFSDICIIVSLLYGSTSFATDVFVDTTVRARFTEPGAFADTPLVVARDQLRSDLSSGVYDSYNIRMPLADSEDTEASLTTILRGQKLTATRDEYLLSVTGQGFGRLPSSIQNQVLDHLMEYYTAAYVKSYRATVDPEANRLVDVNFFNFLGIRTADLTDAVPAERLLSSYARTWAYQTSRRDGPNCWHTAIASTNLAWTKHRYMNASEFYCQIRNGYRTLDLNRETLEYGDVISLVDRQSNPVHAFVYLGPDSNNPNNFIVFTKNGFRQGAFLFEDFYTVVNYIYPGNTAEYYRAVKHLDDPSAISGTPCARDYRLDLDGFLEVRGLLNDDPRRADPIIVAGLKKFGSESMPALRF